MANLRIFYQQKSERLWSWRSFFERKRRVVNVMKRQLPSICLCKSTSSGNPYSTFYPRGTQYSLLLKFLTKHFAPAPNTLRFAFVIRRKIHRVKGIFCQFFDVEHPVLSKETRFYFHDSFYKIIPWSVVNYYSIKTCEDKECRYWINNSDFFVDYGVSGSRTQFNNYCGKWSYLFPDGQTNEEPSE